MRFQAAANGDPTKKSIWRWQHYRTKEQYAQRLHKCATKAAIKQQYIAGIITSSRAIAGCNSATCTLLFNPFQTTGLSSGLIATKCGWGASLNWKVEMSQETKGVSPLQPPESGGSRKHTKGRDESTLNPTALNPKPLNPKPLNPKPCQPKPLLQTA